jgi:DNA-binding XRE family transcriptional regulator
VNNLKITLAAARVNAGLTQSEVASIMHVSKQSIINWEKGKIKLKPAQLEMLLRLYNISMDNIFLP